MQSAIVMCKKIMEEQGVIVCSKGHPWGGEDQSGVRDRKDV